ncbi:774_t:CDS:2, partial [Entrophospora sp. SA101]
NKALKTLIPPVPQERHWIIAASKKKQQEYIMEVFYKKNKAPLFRPIPITKEEYIAQNKEENLELLIILQEVTNLFNTDNELDYHDDLGYPGITQQEF